MRLFGTKAETLERLTPLLITATVPQQLFFTVSDFSVSGDEIVATIIRELGGSKLAVRSSAFNEDGAAQSMAGAFRSCLNVDGSEAVAVRNAILEVIASYAGNPRDQVLVQSMVTGVVLSGVIMTYDLDSGAPYYILNYDDESGRTDRITGGTGVNKTVVVYRNYEPAHIESARVAAMLEMARELEAVCGGSEPLDIEFAMTAEGTLHLLQVRRITAQRNWNRGVQTAVSDAIDQITRFFAERSRPRYGLLGARTALGQMPDWNPAEIIGTNPRPLAIALYRSLVTDQIWQEARSWMGYRGVPGEKLMVVLGGHPYIDVRNSFNSFLPADLDEETGHALVNAWLDRLDTHPEFHDKVEFQVAQTALDFTYEQDFAARYGTVLSGAQRDRHRDCLRRLTQSCLDLSRSGTLPQALRLIQALEARQTLPLAVAGTDASPLWHAVTLLNECRHLGTLPFAVIARHAFIAESLLRSMVARGALAPERLEAFKRSLVTVAGELSRDFHAVMTDAMERDDFLARYGHLRPGTYDILSLRYDQRDDLFRAAQLPAVHQRSEPFRLTATERTAIADLIAEAQFDHLTPEELLDYAALAIVQREEAKFVFTRHLSDVLECIAQWGEEIGLTRDDLSYLTLDEILDTLNMPILTDSETYLARIVETRRQTTDMTRSIRLGYIVRGERDICIVPLHRNAPNFVTSLAIKAETVFLDGRMTGHVELYNKIVCIENADPGYDWVFTRNIAGLISKFGGANSHMTIRCAELGLPAAIGVGEQTFERLVRAGAVELDCRDRIVRPASGIPISDAHLDQHSIAAEADIDLQQAAVADLEAAVVYAGRPEELRRAA